MLIPSNLTENEEKQCQIAAKIFFDDGWRLTQETEITVEPIESSERADLAQVLSEGDCITWLEEDPDVRDDGLGEIIDECREADLTDAQILRVLEIISAMSSAEQN